MSTLEDRKDRTWAEVNLDNVVYNFRTAQRNAAGKKAMCVIKADAYGHGAVQAAKALSEAGVQYFAVAAAQEALQLRRHGITQDILLLGTPSADCVDALDEADITLTISSAEAAQSFARVLTAKGSCRKVHVKVNSGMGRQGFEPQEALQAICRINEYPCYEVEGVYTHLAVADDPSQDEYTNRQYEKTAEVVKEARAAQVPVKFFHAENSAGIIAHNEFEADMVRPGIMLYGSNPCIGTPADLKPVMSIKSRIASVKELKAGESVSYGRTWTASRDSKIAVINTGYADGLFRGLSGKLQVLVNGKRVNQIGRICMDMCMIDVTDAVDVKIGDTATIIGRQGDEEITADEIAALAGTISYEIFCAVSKRVPRIYIKGGREISSSCALESL